MKYNNGDEVILIEDNAGYGHLSIGQKGIVRGNRPECGEDSYAIEFNFEFPEMHDCNGLVPSGRGWMVREKEIILNADYLIKQKKELLDALRKLWSVKSNPWTDEQALYKMQIECEVEEILKKYEND